MEYLSIIIFSQLSNKKHDVEGGGFRTLRVSENVISFRFMVLETFFEYRFVVLETIFEFRLMVSEAIFGSKRVV